MDETTPKKVSILQKLPFLSSFLLGLATFFLPLFLFWLVLSILPESHEAREFGIDGLYILILSAPLAIFSLVMMFVYYQLLTTNRVKKLFRLLSIFAIVFLVLIILWLLFGTFFLNLFVH